MTLEEFLKEYGNNYDLRVYHNKDGTIRITIQSMKIDCEESMKDFSVKDNIVSLIENENT